MKVQRYRYKVAVLAYIRNLPESTQGRVAQGCRQVLLDAGVTGVHDQFVGADTEQNDDAWADFGARVEDDAEFALQLQMGMEMEMDGMLE